MDEIRWLRTQLVRLSGQSVPAPEVHELGAEQYLDGVRESMQVRAVQPADDFDPDETVEFAAVGATVLPFRSRAELDIAARLTLPRPPAGINPEVVSLMNRLSQRLTGEDAW